MKNKRKEDLIADDIIALKRKLNKNDFEESFRFNEGKDFFRDNKRYLNKLDLAASNYQ